MISNPATVADNASSSLVSVRAVSKHYATVRAVDAVDLDIGSGELFGLIGHNGAGKSTLFKLMLGLLPTSAGEILIDGESVAGRGFRAVRRKLGYLPENVVLYDNLTGLETLRFFARLKAAPAGDCERALAQVGLVDAGQRRVREYSKGMRQRLGFACALLGTPQLLFLDEPTVGLDPEGIREFYAILAELRSTGVTVVLSSHILADIQQRVDRLAIMVSGRIRAIGSVQSLREQVDLPLTFAIRVAPAGLDALASRLGDLALGSPSVADGLLLLRCPRAAKMRVFAALSGSPGDLLDVQIHEPSLEDVFIGLATAVNPWN